MKQSQFIGWVKKAYPDIKIAAQQNGDYWFSNTNFLQVSAKSSGELDFYNLRGRDLREPISVTDDVQIVNNIRGLWGDPKVAFSVSKPESKPEETKREEPKPEESKPEPKKEQPKDSEQALSREKALELLKTKFPDSLEVIKVPGGKAVKINGSKLTLYDYGVSSKPSEFIPWAREEEVRQCITKFIKQQHHE